MSQLGGYQGIVRDALAYLNPMAPTVGTFGRSNLPRHGLYDSAGDTGNVALTTQVMTSVPVFLQAGDTITNISAISGATAAGTPTNWWASLYSNAATPALLAQTADQLTAAWAANTVKTLALSTAQLISVTGVYWVGLHVKATAVPSLLGTICAQPVLAGERKLAQTSGSALTGTAPATIATPAVANFAPLVILT